MEKIVMRIDTNLLTAIDNILEDTPRIYRHFEIVKINIFTKQMFKSLKPHLSLLTSLTITKSDFENLNDYYILMQGLKCLQELNLDRVYIRNAQSLIPKPIIKFTFLKRLKLNCCHAIIYENSFDNCSKLEKFYIKAGCNSSVVAGIALERIFCNNVNLKFLEIRFDVFGLIFLNKFKKQLNFKLKKFHAGNINHNFGDASKHFINFLIMQSETLEEVVIENWMGLETMKVIFSMPRLKVLKLTGFHHFDTETMEWNLIEFHANPSIETFHFHDISGNFEIFKCVMKTCKNLKKCHLYSLTREMVKFLASNCVKLESVCVEKMLCNSFDHPLMKLVHFVEK